MDQQSNLVRVVQRLSCCRSLEAIVGVLRDSTRQLVGADGITIVLRDNGQCHYCEEDSIAPLWRGKRFPMSACISGWCMIHGQQVVIPDIYLDARIPHDAYRPTFVKSLAMTPIRSSDPVGAIGAYWAKNHQATPEELSILQSLGDSAAMALENAQLIEQLKSANQRKDEFISMLAHELRNPLSPIKNGLSLLKMQDNQNEATETACEMMDRQVVHLSRIVDDLLDVARINSGKVALRRSRFDLAAVLNQCLSDHRPAFESAGLALRTEIPSSSVWLDGDATRMTQVFGNILDNARKFTPPGGSIRVKMSTDSNTQNARIDFIDSGMGISEELLPTIFESFTQADNTLDRTGGGLGLGLSVASGLTSLHGGTIAAHSEGKDKGATFTVTLPNVQSAAVSSEANSASPGNGKLHVAIIEDNRDTANSMQKLLKLCGYRASVAYDGQTGLDMARAEHPDVVLCDIGLPGIDGFSVASQLRKEPHTSHMRLIAVTGYGSDEDRDKALASGFDVHMVKPVDLKALLTQIQQSPRTLASA